jgi:hypothetical protein
MTGFADSRQLWRGAMRSLFRSLFLDFIFPVRRQKASCSPAEIVAEGRAKVHAAGA